MSSFNEDRNQKYLRYAEFKETGIPQALIDRRLYFNHLIYEVFISLPHRVEDCEVMDEFALLSSILKDIPCKISYIKF